MRILATSALAASLLLATTANGSSGFPSQIPNGGVNSCNNCHIGFPSPRTAFAADYVTNGHLWNSVLAAKDSDGDGFSNGVELQDPGGTWVAGQPNPGTSALVTNPGSSTSHPPTPTPTPAPSPSPSPAPSPSASASPTASPTPAPAGQFCDNSPDPIYVWDGDLFGVNSETVIAGDRVITDMNVHVKMTHPYIGNIVLQLTHMETGSYSYLVSVPGFDPSTAPDGCPNADMDCTFDDAAAAPADDACAFPGPAIGGTLSPYSPLAAFNGEALGGTWVLNAVDTRSGNSGYLDDWCLLPTTVLASPSPTATPTPTPPDNGQFCDTLASPAFITDGSSFGIDDTIQAFSPQVITGLRVSLQVTHPRVGNLRVTLAHQQSGRSITLLAQPGFTPGNPQGCANDNIDVTFSDTAGGLANDQCDAPPPAIFGSQQPVESLSAFAGMTMTGTWVLNVADVSSGESGTLDGWCLIPIYNPPEPDDDMDGFGNYTEIAYSSDPFDAASKPTFGDYNGSGTTDQWDAFALQRDGSAPFDARFDVNRDGAIDACDARILYLWSTGQAPYDVIPILPELNQCP